MRYWGPNQETGWIIRKASESILSAAPERVSALITEVVGTLSALRAAVSPRYQFDARAWDLERNFALDGYRIEGRNLVAIDPTVAGTTELDDDLDALLSFSALPDRSAIRISLEKSAEDFKKQPPDFNVCLTNVRVALEASAKSIANQRGWQPSGEARWGEAVSYLRQSGFIRRGSGTRRHLQNREPGAHEMVDFDESDFARVGRRLAALMCYFLLKRSS
jgi:hypothetical protein